MGKLSLRSSAIIVKKVSLLNYKSTKFKFQVIRPGSSTFVSLTFSCFYGKNHFSLFGGMKSTSYVDKAMVYTVKPLVANPDLYRQWSSSFHLGFPMN